MPSPSSTTLLNTDLIIQKADIRAGQQIADFGCGQFGFFAFLFADHLGAGGLVYAIDIISDNLKMIDKELAIQPRPQIKTLWADLEVAGGTKLATGSLDLILLINTLHQAGQPQAILAEAVRLLKNHGRLLIVDWDDQLLTGTLGPRRRLDVHDLQHTAQTLGLARCEQFRAGQYSFGLTLEKI